MKKFSVGQLKALSTMSGNAAIAWFSAGFIGPIVTNTIRNNTVIINMTASLLLTILYSFIVLIVVKKVKT